MVAQVFSMNVWICNENVINWIILVRITTLISVSHSEPEEVTLREIAKDSYDSILGSFHPWAIRKAVALAVYALPSRDQLVTDIIDDQPVDSNLRERDECKIAILNEALPAMRAVYDSVQKVFSEHNLLDLAWLCWPIG